MNQDVSELAKQHMPFFLPEPGQTDVLFILVAIAMVLTVLGLGALYFTIQAWPDRLAKGTGKAQLQLVGILGLVSLITLNNAFWIAGLLIAALRVPDIVTPLREISSSLKQQTGGRD